MLLSSQIFGLQEGSSRFPIEFRNLLGRCLPPPVSFEALYGVSYISQTNGSGKDAPLTTMTVKRRATVFKAVVWNGKLVSDRRKIETGPVRILHVLT